MKSIFFLSILVVIQIVDISPGLKEYVNGKSFNKEKIVLDDPIWKKIEKNYEVVSSTQIKSVPVDFYHLLGFLRKAPIKSEVAYLGRVNRQKLAALRYLNNNNFYSLDANSGIINWMQNVNSALRPIIIDDLIFTISNKGYFVVIDSKRGDIIRITDLSISFKKKKRGIIKTVFLGRQTSNKKGRKEVDAIQGFVIASNKLYVTTISGKLMVYSIFDGQLDQIYKVSKSKLSEPFISNSNLYIFRNNAVVVLN
mgnify:CR=1 FL=1